MKHIIRLMTMGLFVLATCGSAQNLITNGSFELPVIGESYRPLPSGSTEMPGWTVGATGNVEIIRTHWPASDGANSLDMNGVQSGSVSQNVFLTNGLSYLLTFDMAYNTALFQPMTLHASIGGCSQSFTNDRAAGGPFWQHKKLFFTATNTGLATLKFEDTSNSQLSGGAALDNVCLIEASSLLSIKMYAGIKIEGTIGRTYRIDCVDIQASTNSWTTITNLVLPSSPYVFMDIHSPSSNSRFYRAVLLP